MNHTPGRIIGIDYGTRRIGIAVSDPLNIIARSVGVIPNDNNAIRAIEQYVKEFSASCVVVGMPYALRGGVSAKGKEVETFVAQLRSTLSVYVTTVDERFTSTMARTTLLTMGTTSKQRRRKETIDEMASALILQSYLDRRKA